MPSALPVSSEWQDDAESSRPGAGQDLDARQTWAPMLESGMSYVVVDVEADGPIPAEFSMVCFGAVLFDEALDKSFYGQTRPITDRFIPEAFAVSGFSREQHLTFHDPKAVMEAFAAWLDQHCKGRPVFVSDNVAFKAEPFPLRDIRLLEGPFRHANMN
jgi:hypothetical protein